MLQIIRAPSGGWERDPVTGDRGRQLWHNRRGRRTLTNYARNLPALRNWEDVVVHVPVLERQIGLQFQIRGNNQPSLSILLAARRNLARQQGNIDGLVDCLIPLKRLLYDKYKDRAQGG